MSYAPGWYPDPAAPAGGGLRWFDGAQWTGHTHTAPAAVPAQPPYATQPTGWGGPQPGAAPAGAVEQPVAQPTAAQPAVPQPAVPQPWGAAPPQQQWGAPAPGARPASMFGARKGWMVALGAFLAFRVLVTLSQEGLGGLVGLLGGAAVVLAVGLPLFLRARRRNGQKRVAEAQAAGRLEGALWVGYVQRNPPNATNPFAAFRPSFYRGFASGLLVVAEGGVRFLPGPRAVRNGHRPWALETGQIEAVEARRLPLGAWLYLRPRGGPPIELGLQSGGGTPADFTAVLGGQGVPVVGGRTG